MDTEQQLNDALHCSASPRDVAMAGLDCEVLGRCVAAWFRGNLSYESALAHAALALARRNERLVDAAIKNAQLVSRLVTEWKGDCT